MAGYDDDLRFAHVLADAADDITTRRFRALDLRVESKPDLTPVTDADKAAEESLRNVLRRSRPRDAVLGEEFGRDGGGPRCWVIDPIDGTKNYVRGVPVWATLIGLMDGDQVVMGVVSAPALGRRWWAASDNGAWTGKSLTKATRCRVSDVRRIEDASFSYSSLTGWEERGLLPGFLERYADTLTPEHQEVCHLFVEHLPAYLRLRGGPGTVSHGDFRLDNLLFQPDDPRPVVVDWQTAAWGGASADVAYFIGGCLGTEDRRAHEQELLAHYHDALRRRGVRDYSLVRLRADSRRDTFAGILMAIVASMVVQRTERGDLMFLTSATRHAQHALDAGAPALLLAAG